MRQGFAEQGQVSSPQPSCPVSPILTCPPTLHLEQRARDARFSRQPKQLWKPNAVIGSLPSSAALWGGFKSNNSYLKWMSFLWLSWNCRARYCRGLKEASACLELSKHFVSKELSFFLSSIYGW